MIQVKLGPLFLRNEKLLEEIASVALVHTLPVELEGSILSHAYYILQKKGVRVLCPNVWEDDLTGDIQTFGKLVRDYIPELIQSHGEQANFVQLSGAQLLMFLKAKAVEETLELYVETDAAKAFEELADLHEVMAALLRYYRRTQEELEAEAAHKRSVRGGFEQGLVLLETSHIPLLDIQEPGLFQVEHKLIQRKSYSDYEQELRLALQPKWKDSILSIPLVPSPVEKTHTPIILPLDDDRELLIHYRDKSVDLSIRTIDNREEDPNQLKLFEDEDLCQDVAK